MRFNAPAKGFTLIELVIGIVVFSVAMTMVFSVIVPRAEQSVDPIYQVRAAKLASALMSEISSKAYDENSNPSLAQGPCGSSTNPLACTASLGPEEGATARNLFDDVDDYDGFTIDGLLLNDNSAKYADLYANYQLSVSVDYDGDYDGTADTATNAKLITVTVTMPNNEQVSFASYRGNY
ncbi:MAG: type IV pilus modification PilV family protein [Psychrobium sp.]